MIVGRIVLLGLLMAAFGHDSLRCADMKPHWTIVAPDRPNQNEPGGLTNRSCGIAKWDATHTLIYFLTANKHLAVRGSADKMEGGWSFSIQIIETNSGQVEQSATIPAWNPRSELAVVAGGIVESDHDRLLFYSRSFKRFDDIFIYKPTQSLPDGISGLYGLSDSEQLYVTENQKLFVLVDGSTNQSHFFVFDGTTFEKQKDWAVPGADWRSITIRNEGLLYTKYSSRSQVFLTTFDGRIESLQGVFGLFDPQICSFSLPNDTGSLLYVCGSVKIVSPTNSDTLYQPKNNEVVGLPVVISPNKRFAAIYDFSYKGGGLLDLTEKITHVALLVVNLDSTHRICHIPIMPIPLSQLTFQYVDDSILIVMSDSTVTAYKEPCKN